MEETKQAIINKKFPIVVSLIVCILGSFLGGFLVVVTTNTVYKNEPQVFVANQVAVQEDEAPIQEDKTVPEYDLIESSKTESIGPSPLIDQLSLEDLVGWGMAFITGVEITIYGFVKFRWGFDHNQSNIIFFILAGLWFLIIVYVGLIIRSIGGLH